MLASHKEGYMKGTMLKNTEIFDCKEAIANKGKWWKGGKAEIQDENFLLSKIHTKWTTIIWQSYKPDGDVMAGKNSLGSKVMGYTSNAFKVYCRSH